MSVQFGFRWHTRPEDVFPPGYKEYTAAVFTTGRRVAAARAEEAREWMKQNAPWQDRTGDARRGLDVKVIQEERIIAQLIFHHDQNLKYPIYLETMQQGRFAIIAPAVDYWGARLMADMQRIVNLGHAAKG